MNDDTIRTIGSLYQAGFQPDRWPDALDELRRLFDGACAVTFLVDAGTGDIPVWLGVGTELGEDEYVDELNRINPRAHLSMALKPGDVVYDQRVLPEDAIGRDPFYDWLTKFDLRYFIGTRLFESGPLNAFTGIERTSRQGHVNEQDVALFERLSPHLAQSVQLTLSTRALKAKSAAYETALNLLDCGVAALDKRGKVIFLNHRAEEIFLRGDGLTLREGEIRALRSAETRRLQQMFARVLASAASEQIAMTDTCLVARRDTGRPLVVSVCPAPAQPIATGAADAAILVIIRDPGARSPETETIRLLFGLTPRETALAAALTDGYALPAAAARLGIAPNTARVHLQAIFKKTGVRSQVALVALLAKYTH